MYAELDISGVTEQSVLQVLTSYTLCLLSLLLLYLENDSNSLMFPFPSLCLSLKYAILIPKHCV